MGSSTDAFFRKDITFLPLFVRRATFAELSGFSSDYRVLCCDYEFAAKAQLAGRRCETVLLELGDVLGWDPDWLSAKGYDIAVSQFRAIRPQLAAVPLGLRDMLLLSKGLQIRPGGLGRQARPKEGGDSVLDDALSRMMQSVMQVPKGRQAARSKAATVSAGAGVRGSVGVMGLIDELESHRPEKKPPAPKPKPGRPPVSRLGHNIVQKGSLVGQILAVYQGAVYGWALDMEDDARKIGIVLAGAGAENTTVTADFTLPLAIAAPQGVDGHGFCIPLRPGWVERLPARKLLSFMIGSRPPSTFSLSTTDGLVLTSEIVLPGIGSEMSALGWKGFCDASDDGIIKGWAAREAHSDERLDIAVFVEQHFLMRVCADRYREDVHNHGHGDGEYGFFAPLPQIYRDGTQRRIDVVLADSGLPLARSPLWAEGRRISHKPQHSRQG